MAGDRRIETKCMLGCGVVGTLTSTKDGSGVHIEIKGTFRHGGQSHEVIVSKLLMCFRDLDLDTKQDKQLEG